MPKNTLILAAVAVIAIIGIGGFLFLNQNKSSVENMMTTDENAMQSLLAQGVSMECNYEDEDSGTVTAYIKDGRVRTNFVDENGETGSVILRDNMIYFWNNEGAFKMEMPDPTDVDAMEEKAEEAENMMPDSSDPSEIVDEIENYREYCKDASVADSNFELPAGVTFQDMSTYMDSMMQQDGGNTRGAVDNMPSQEQMDALMQQYGGQQ